MAQETPTEGQQDQKHVPELQRQVTADFLTIEDRIRNLPGILAVPRAIHTDTDTPLVSLETWVTAPGEIFGDLAGGQPLVYMRLEDTPEDIYVPSYLDPNRQPTEEQRESIAHMMKELGVPRTTLHARVNRKSRTWDENGAEIMKDVLSDIYLGSRPTEEREMVDMPLGDKLIAVVHSLAEHSDLIQPVLEEDIDQIPPTRY